MNLLWKHFVIISFILNLIDAQQQQHQLRGIQRDLIVDFDDDDDSSSEDHDNPPSSALYYCKNQNTQEIVSEQFNDNNQIDNTWGPNMNTFYVEKHGNILGKFEKDLKEMSKVFTNIPQNDVDTIAITFDFFEIGEWEGSEIVNFVINGEKISMGTFSNNNNGEQDDDYHATNISGILLERTSKGVPAYIIGSKEDEQKDEIHSVTITLRNWIVSQTGTIEFQIKTKKLNNESAGINNFRILTNSCDDDGTNNMNQKVVVVSQDELCTTETIAYEKFSAVDDSWLPTMSVFPLKGYGNVLGLFGTNNLEEMSKSYTNITKDASYIIITLKFFEIGNYEGTETVNFVINNDQVLPMGIFDKNKGGQQDGIYFYTSNGITLERKSDGKPAFLTDLDKKGGNKKKKGNKSEIHSVKITIPNQVYSESGTIDFKIQTELNNEKAGIDRFKIVANIC